MRPSVTRDICRPTNMAPERGKMIGCSALDRSSLRPGSWMRPLCGDGTMLNLSVFEPGARAPLHDHPHDQFGSVISGEPVLEIDGVECERAVGDAPRIRGATPHSTWPDGLCKILDVFHPVREDFKAKAQA